MTKLITQLTNQSDQSIIQFHINNWLIDGFKLDDIIESFKLMSQGLEPEVPLDRHTLNLILTYGKTNVNKTIKHFKEVG